MTRLTSWIWALGAAVSTLAAGCGDTSGGSRDGADAANSVLVNGQPAAQFYRQFSWEVTRSAGFGNLQFPWTSDGRNAASIELFLMPNGVTKLFYVEGKQVDGVTTYVEATKKRREGMWRVSGAKLIVDGLLDCDGLEINMVQSMHCTLSTAVVTPDAQGRAGYFQSVYSHGTPDDPQWDSYMW